MEATEGVGVAPADERTDGSEFIMKSDPGPGEALIGPPGPRWVSEQPWEKPDRHQLPELRLQTAGPLDSKGHGGLCDGVSVVPSGNIHHGCAILPGTPRTGGGRWRMG